MSYKCMIYKRIGSVLSLCLLMASPIAKAEEGLDVRYLHVMMGKFDAEDSWIVEPEEDSFAADINDMIYGGAAVQIGTAGSAWQYGFESGGMVTYTSDRSTFTRVDENGLTRYVEVDNSLWIFDVAMGGFVSYRPIDWVRVYASAGPAVLIGSMYVDDDDVEIDEETKIALESNNGNVYLGTGDRETDVDVGFYGRVGVDFILSNGFVIGASMRRIDGELDFKDNGTLELDDNQYFLTLGKAF